MILREPEEDIDPVNRFRIWVEHSTERDHRGHLQCAEHGIPKQDLGIKYSYRGRTTPSDLVDTEVGIQELGRCLAISSQDVEFEDKTRFDWRHAADITLIATPSSRTRVRTSKAGQAHETLEEFLREKS